MIHPNVAKFKSLLETDPDVQKKVTEAAAGYTGERTEEAIFRNIIAPIAEEYNVPFSLEDLQESAASSEETIDLAPEELAQISGGKGGGLGVDLCVWGLGVGAGLIASKSGGAVCIAIGVGHGAGYCLAEGNAGSLEEVCGDE